YADFSNGVPDGEWDVLIVNRNNLDSVTTWMSQNQTTAYGAPVPSQHRIWFPESYKTRLPDKVLSLDTWQELFDGIKSGEFISAWADFWLYHDPDRLNPTPRTDVRCQSCGSVDGVVFFPAAFDRET